MSTPVTFAAPSCLIESVSCPALHCRCSTDLPAQVAEQLDLFREQLVAALAEELRLVVLVAVVRLRRLVPGQPVLLVQRRRASAVPASYSPISRL